MRTLLFVWFVGPLVRGFPGSLVVLLLFDPGNKLFAFWLSSFAGGSFVEIYFVFRSSLIYLHWMLNVIVIATVILCRALWKISIAHFLSVLPASFSNSVDFVGFISVFPLPPSLSLSLSLLLIKNRSKYLLCVIFIGVEIDCESPVSKMRNAMTLLPFDLFLIRLLIGTCLFIYLF